MIVEHAVTGRFVKRAQRRSENPISPLKAHILVGVVAGERVRVI